MIVFLFKNNFFYEQNRSSDARLTKKKNIVKKASCKWAYIIILKQL